MYEWEVEYINTETKGSWVSCECWTATVCADTEDEVRAIMEEEAPDKTIVKITRVMS